MSDLVRPFGGRSDRFGCRPLAVECARRLLPQPNFVVNADEGARSQAGRPGLQAVAAEGVGAKAAAVCNDAGREEASEVVIDP